jgi:hypothetical protein
LIESFWVDGYHTTVVLRFSFFVRFVPFRGYSHLRFVFAPLRLCVRFDLAMRYLVKARVKPGLETALARAIEEKTLGRGSVAGDEYLWDMEHARVTPDHAVTWVEVCFCAAPLAEERPYWEEYFDLLSVKDAHARKDCRDLNGQEPWACTDCDCTKKLEEWLSNRGDPFLAKLKVR